MPKRFPNPARSARRNGARTPASPALLEVQRDQLLARLLRLHASAKQRLGYKTAASLLNPIFRRSSLAARAAVLEAANFMIAILKRTSPLT